METIEYRLSEFAKVNTKYFEYMPKIKVIKPNGETKWLDITEAELQGVIQLLTKSN